MTTEAQITANRTNAEKSTGPRTPEGKAKVAQNAVQHGLLAREAVVTGEDMDQFDLFREQLRADLAPVGMVESLLAERIVGLSWRLQRAERFHTEAFDTLYAQCAADPQSLRGLLAPGPDRGDPIFGTTVVKDFSQTKVLERLLGYERRMEHSLYRSMAELRSLKAGRREEGQKRRRSEGQTVSPSAVPTFLPSSVVSALPEEVGRGRRTLDQVEGRLYEEPEGVATNVPEGQEAARETKPIDGGIRGQGSGVSNLTPDTRPLDPELSCETKPICEGIGVQGSGVSSLKPDPRPLTPALSCETKPISARVIKDGEGYRPIFRRRR